MTGQKQVGDYIDGKIRNCPSWTDGFLPPDQIRTLPAPAPHPSRKFPEPLQTVKKRKTKV